ncbi:MAG: type II toxin-antitoxin system VapC family toxin [Opitutales bacterium]|nr:type II toxin-antitoxin system VapC family toxin [Opitutales bacterium]MCH8540057.1 type II toxin-antitoxin system VapC family toxin [Opitutales bacterium]
MAFLLDTNVLSELRRGDQCDPNVRSWAKSLGNQPCYISVLSLGEIRKGIEILRRRSPRQVPAFEQWLERLTMEYEDFILPITEEVADHWGQINAKQSQPVIDSLLAATALYFRLTVATRNIADFPREVPTLNPWEDKR